MGWSQKVSTARARTGLNAFLLVILALAPAGPRNASADSVAAAGATLPSGRHLTSAVWTGQHSYVFGGFLGGPDASSPGTAISV